MGGALSFAFWREEKLCLRGLSCPSRRTGILCSNKASGCTKELEERDPLVPASCSQGKLPSTEEKSRKGSSLGSLGPTEKAKIWAWGLENCSWELTYKVSGVKLRIMDRWTNG